MLFEEQILLFPIYHRNLFAYCCLLIGQNNTLYHFVVTFTVFQMSPNQIMLHSTCLGSSRFELKTEICRYVDWSKADIFYAQRNIQRSATLITSHDVCSYVDLTSIHKPRRNSMLSVSFSGQTLGITSYSTIHLFDILSFKLLLNTAIVSSLPYVTGNINNQPLAWIFSTSKNAHLAMVQKKQKV